jgi:hypothetical protein
MSRIIWLAAAALLGSAACAGAATPTPSAPTSVPLTSSATAAMIVLDRAPADLGCDAIGWPGEVEPFSSLTFRVDPAAANHVTAESDTGVALVVEWVPGFEGGTADERVVRDPEGQVVLRDGETVEVPSAANPELHGHPLCLTPTSVSVMLELG